MHLEGYMYQEKETKYDNFAKKLYYDFRRTKKERISHWDKLDFKERDEWRGIAQLKKRESKYFKKLRKQAGEKDERHTTRIG